MSFRENDQFIIVECLFLSLIFFLVIKSAFSETTIAMQVFLLPLVFGKVTSTDMSTYFLVQ